MIGFLYLKCTDRRIRSANQNVCGLIKMACDCQGKPKCAEGKKAWYEKMMSAKRLKGVVKGHKKVKVEKKVKKPIY